MGTEAEFLLAFKGPLLTSARPKGNWIPLVKPEIGPEELTAMSAALRAASGEGTRRFVRLSEDLLSSMHAPARALLTHSCTAALELATLLLDLQPGDEVIMPSFTFSSTANAVALRGAVPVFVDIRPDTLNLDEDLVEAAITPRTRAIFPIHYGGVACEMDTLLALAQRHGLHVIEDAAQALGARYKGRPLGSLGTMGAVSFHETKNVTCGEGGCLLVRDSALLERAQVCRDKGTNRAAFLARRVDHYSWTDLGSAYGMHEIAAACLYAQVGKAEQIMRRRLELWHRYDSLLRPVAQREEIRLPIVPQGCDHNGHVYYVLARDLDHRNALMHYLNAKGIGASFHYIPLHNSPAGRRYGRAHGSMAQTENCAARILRLPLYPSLAKRQQDTICSQLSDALRMAPASLVSAAADAA